MITDYAEQEVRQLEAMKTRIQALVEALPDNPNINRVSKNAFTMKASEMFKHDNWLPEFHDFKAQYRLVLSRLDSSKSIAEFKAFLSKAIEDKQMRKGKYTHKLHPEVVIKLEKLL